MGEGAPARSCPDDDDVVVAADDGALLGSDG